MTRSKKSTTVPGTPLEIAIREKTRTNGHMRTAQRTLSAAQTVLKEAQEAVAAAQAVVTEKQFKFLAASASLSELKAAEEARTAEPDFWTVPSVMNGRPVTLKCRARLS